MIIDRIIKTGRYILGGLLLSGMIIACTNDYFVDENNYRIYVPQIQQRTIQDFYVAFHDADGNHLRTRRFSEADFNEPYITDGLIRSKLKAGEEANIMCFAQLNTIAVTEGQPLSQSFLSLPPIDENKHIYTTARLDCRVFHKVRTIYPIGHPLSQVPDTISMNEECVYTGTIGVNFKNLPGMVDRVEVFYSGLATRMNFDGTMGTFAPSDRVWVSYSAADDHSLVKFKDSFLPSAGTLIGAKAGETVPQQGRTPLKLEVIFYEGDRQVGYLTEADLGGEFPVTDGKGNPVSGDVFLEPRGTIEFNFEGFTLVDIALKGWGDIITPDPDDVTPV